MPQKNTGPALLWRDNRLGDELVEELLDVLNDPSTPEGPYSIVLGYAFRIVAGQNPFADLVDTTWVAPSIRIIVSHSARVTWELEKTRADHATRANLPYNLQEHDRIGRLMTALALIWDSDSLPSRFKRCPECGTFWVAVRASALRCSPACRKLASRHRTGRHK